MGSILSGIMGGGSSPGQQAQMQGLKATQQDLQSYRPEAMQARLNLLSNASAPYQGMNNALETLWGAPQASPQGLGQLRSMGTSGSRVMGHDLPQQLGPPQMVGSDPRYTRPSEPDPVSQVLDPLNLFGGW